MRRRKRLFDLAVASALAVPLAPVIGGLALAAWLVDGRPVFYVSERMKTATQGFRLIKFRTMTVAATDSGVSGGDKKSRITRLGGLLRRTRLDELPQLWNVLRGDISFVGPRPPLRQYVEQYPEIYREVLRSRPGITGLATLVFHDHEEWLLARCATTAETDEVYRRACIPRKARLDMIYQKNESIGFDMAILMKTVFKRLR